MTESQLNTPQAKLARRLESNRNFMAYVLAEYRRQEDLTLEELAQEIGVMPLMLVRLALCSRPDSTTSAFAEQVREIADFTLTDEVQLAQILRQVDVLEMLSRRPSSDPSTSQAAPDEIDSGLLAAARDRYASEDDEPTTSDDGLPPED